MVESLTIYVNCWARNFNKICINHVIVFVWMKFRTFFHVMSFKFKWLILSCQVHINCISIIKFLWSRKFSSTFFFSRYKKILISILFYVLPFLFTFFIFSSLPRWQCMMLVVNIATQKGLKRKETFFLFCITIVWKSEEKKFLFLSYKCCKVTVHNCW